MSEPNLTHDEREAVLKVLQATIVADRFPLSPRIRTLKSALAKLDAKPGATEPYPPPRAWVNSSIGQRKRRR